MKLHIYFPVKLQNIEYPSFYTSRIQGFFQIFKECQKFEEKISKKLLFAK